MSFSIPTPDYSANVTTTKYAWKTLHAYLNQQPPVQNTYYEIFNQSGGVILKTLKIQQDNTPTDAEDIDILITVDGRTIFYDHVINALNHGTLYTAFMTAAGLYVDETGSFDVTALPASPVRALWMADPTSGAIGFPLKGHEIKVEVRQTSAIEAGSRLRGWCVYDKLEAVT